MFWVFQSSRISLHPIDPGTLPNTEATWFSIEEDAWEAPICVVLKDVAFWGIKRPNFGASPFCLNRIYVYIYMYIYTCNCLTEVKDVLFPYEFSGNVNAIPYVRIPKNPDTQCFFRHIYVHFYPSTLDMSSFHIFSAYQDDADEMMGTFFDLQVSVSVGLKLGW